LCKISFYFERRFSRAHEDLKPVLKASLSASGGAADFFGSGFTGVRALFPSPAFRAPGSFRFEDFIGVFLTAYLLLFTL
jgi:hypothetical protein